MQKYLGFDELITPTIIKIIYWIGIAVIIIGVIASLFVAGFGPFIGALIGGVIGLVFWRVWCEIMLILFRIHDDLKVIARNTTPAGSAPRP
jgi:Domain of unknown function (DUF4282)